MILEDKFLEATKKGLEKHVDSVVTEVSLMMQVYKEQLEILVRLRIDIDLFDYLILAQPQVTDHAEKRVKTMDAIYKKRYLVKTIRKQIMEKVGIKKE